MPANPFQQGLSVQVSGDATGANRALTSVMGNLTSMKTLALGAGVALAAAIGVKSVNAAREFQAAMQESIAIMGDVSDAMRDDMEKTAREVATSTTFSAEQAAESYFFLASAGLSARQSIEAMPEVARFAQAGMFDMAEATDLLTDSASALGLAIDDYNRLADVLVKANTLANASVRQFATALKRRAAAEMRNANVELEEGVAVLAAFADQGIKAERAGQVFQRTLLTLQEATRENADAVEELGIRIFDADGEMRGMADIIEDLTDATADMSTEERNAALAALGFTRRTREGIVALLGKSDAIREYQGELEQAGGITEEVAETQLDTFNARLNILKSELNDVAISIGNALLPSLTRLVDGLIDVTRAAKDAGNALVEFMERAEKKAGENWDRGILRGRKSLRNFEEATDDADDSLSNIIMSGSAVVDQMELAADATRSIGDAADDSKDKVKDMVDSVAAIRQDVAGGFGLSDVRQLIEDNADLLDRLDKAESFDLQGKQADRAFALQEARRAIQGGATDITDLPIEVATILAEMTARREGERQSFQQEIFKRLQARGAPIPQTFQEVDVQTEVIVTLKGDNGFLDQLAEGADISTITTKEQRTKRFSPTGGHGISGVGAPG